MRKTKTLSNPYQKLIKYHYKKVDLQWQHFRAKSAIVDDVDKQHRHIDIDKLGANAPTPVMTQQHPQISMLIIFLMDTKDYLKLKPKSTLLLDQQCPHKSGR